MRSLGDLRETDWMHAAKILLLALPLACTVEERDDVDLGLDESFDDDVEFREGPVFEGTEVWDKCCPKIGGVTLDSLCQDDISNSCAHLATGGGVEAWNIVNCNTCGTFSPNCSGTRWTNHPGYGYECDAHATRKYTNAIVDDDCWKNSCSAGLTFNTKSPAPTGILGACFEYGTDLAQTWVFDQTVSTMCCLYGGWFDCIPMVGSQCGSTGTMGSAHDYFDERWCSPCEGHSVSDETFGGWDLKRDGSNEWAQSVSCMNIDYEGDTYPGGQGGAQDIFATRYGCGGYAFDASGTLVNNNCD